MTPHTFHNLALSSSGDTAPPVPFQAFSGNAADRGRVRVLVIDDDASLLHSFIALLEAEEYEVVGAASAEDAEFHLGQGAFDAVLCDLCLPGMSGMDLLRRVHGALPDVPIILVTGYGTTELARQALREGASDFIVKPLKSGELPIVVERNLARRMVQRKSALTHRIELNTSYESILDALLSALDTRDTETQGHSERVTAYTMELADKLGVGSEMLYHIERGALLHDIGKIGIPDRILLKPDKLTDAEWAEMRQHTRIGWRMCSRIEMLKTASDIVLHHHERWDGKGYPSGLSGEQIPLGARLFALADTLDAMTSDRPYRAALPVAAARAEILKHAGTQFDPDIVKLFLSIPESRWMYIRALSAK